MSWSEPREGKNREPPFLHSLSFHGRLLGDSLLCYTILMFKNIFPTYGNTERTVSGVGNGNPFQFSCLQNPMDRGARQATVHGVAKSWTRLRDRARPRAGGTLASARQHEAMFGPACQVVSVAGAQAGRPAKTCCVGYTNTARSEDEFGLSITTAS